MSTDRELLELAAKAAGYKRLYEMPVARDRSFYMIEETEGDSFTPWNPLKDDGAALRLAVKLGIEVRRPSKARSIGRVVQAWFPADGNPSRSASSTTSCAVRGCVLTATRRAIVLAAAQIGRAMP